MTSTDAPALQQIELQAGQLFVEVGMPEIAADDPPSAEELHDAAHVLVAVDDSDEPVGYAWLELVGGLPHLEQLSVPPEHGRQGIATALLDTAASWAIARGATTLTLTTFRDVSFNAPFYERRGFVDLPEHEWTDALRDLVAEEAAHGLDPALRVVMRRDLSTS